MIAHSRDISSGVLSILPALVITFVPDHSLATGMVVFAVWAVLTGSSSAWFSRHARHRAWFVAWLWTALAGVVGAMVWVADWSSSFNGIVGFWGLGFGAIVVLRGGREYRLVGGVTVAFGLAQLLMPVNPVVNVGVLGAYFVVLGIWLIIGALSPRATVEDEGAVTTHG